MLSHILVDGRSLCWSLHSAQCTVLPALVVGENTYSAQYRDVLHTQLFQYSSAKMRQKSVIK